MKRIFKKRLGARAISTKDAQPYGEELYSLAKEKGGKLTPQYVVEKAKSKKSVLHNYFTWDDTIAAKEYRIYQARKLMGAIEIVIETDKGKMGQYRAFLNVKDPTLVEEDCAEIITHTYATIETVRGNKFYLSQVIEQAHREMAAWGKRYRQYQDIKGFKKFKTIFKEIKQLQLVS